MGTNTSLCTIASLEKSRMIVNTLKNVDQDMLEATLQVSMITYLNLSTMYHNVLRKPYSASELADWKEMGVSLHKTKHGYDWSNVV